MNNLSNYTLKRAISGILSVSCSSLLALFLFKAFKLGTNEAWLLVLPFLAIDSPIMPFKKILNLRITSKEDNVNVNFIPKILLRNFINLNAFILDVLLILISLLLNKNASRVSDMILGLQISEINRSDSKKQFIRKKKLTLNYILLIFYILLMLLAITTSIIEGQIIEAILFSIPFIFIYVFRKKLV